MCYWICWFFFKESSPKRFQNVFYCYKRSNNNWWLRHLSIVACAMRSRQNKLDTNQWSSTPKLCSSGPVQENCSHPRPPAWQSFVSSDHSIFWHFWTSTIWLNIKFKYTYVSILNKLCFYIHNLYIKKKHFLCHRHIEQFSFRSEK